MTDRKINTGLTEEQVHTAFHRALHDLTDAQVQALVSAETVSRQQGDESLGNAVSLLDTALSAETAARSAADTVHAAALTGLIDSGAKKHLVLTDTAASTKKGVTITYNHDGTYTVDSAGQASTGADYFYLARSSANPVFTKGSVISGCTGGSDSTFYIGIAGTAIRQGNAAVTLQADVSGSVIFSFASGQVFDHMLIQPMICAKEDWDISQAFEAYCPTLPELYAMVLALQAGGGV